jgi:PPK2 family polyphosphate:nucleotide phosphotransferase
VNLPIDHPYRVPFDGTFRIAKSQRAKPAGAPSKKDCGKRLDDLVEELRELQRRLYADNKWAVLLVFQAMDAAGKDGTVRAVMSGINPAGCQVFSFKKPSPQELDHDFLWRTSKCLPERGRIGIFNRSYYEEVLVVRVHPKILDYQQLPGPIDPEELWEERFESIRDHERHLEANGTVILKFFLNVSKEEQRQRFLARIEEREKNWKFAAGDVRERGHWDDYMHAYEEALKATSRPFAPWYAIPADSKAYMRMVVAEIIVDALRALDLKYPTLSPEETAKLEDARQGLLAEE